MLYLCKNFLQIKDMKLKVKYLVVLGLIMAIAVHSLKAEPVDTTTAKMAAYNFFRSMSTETPRSLAEPVIVYKAHGQRHHGERQVDCDYFYVVNIGDEGFVIVAADSRVTPILAYSTTSTFDAGQLPPNVAYMLGEYQEQMDEVDRQQLEAPASVTAQWASLRHQSGNHNRNVIVGPLISSKWAQSPYYNALCPADPRNASGHAVAGCTAVAMGQIIRYWRYPEHGVGSHSYLANNSAQGSDYGDYGMLSADFENTYYDYDNMPDSLTANSTAAQINAVATLLYHCGVSLDMAYGATTSTAVFSLVRASLENYFDFYAPMLVYRSVYSQSSWRNMMKNELDHLRPIFYTGEGNSSIHAFVCDGYDSQGYFHINWGWGGYADGYFLLSNLNPDMENYNSSQSAIINVEIEPQTLMLSEEQLNFFAEEDFPADIQYFVVETMNIDTPIHVSVTGNFKISTDASHFVSYLTLPINGGTVYVKYNPVSQQAHYELGNVTLTTGAAWDTVRLVGVTYYPECHTPLNFTAVQGDIDTDTNQVLLTWQPPVPDVVDASWDSIPQSSFGDVADYTIIQMHRMAISDLYPFHHHRLTHLSFIADSAATDYRLMVYTGGKISDNGRVINPGTLILEQQVDMTSLTRGAWNKVALTSPIVIDASQELWYGLYISAPANSSAVIYGGLDFVPFKGNIYGYYYGGEVFWYPYNRNFVMKARIDNPFVQYEVYRDGTPLAVPATGYVYADYPPEYAHYLYEVHATWNDECSAAASQMVNFRQPCHVQNVADTVTTCDSYVWRDGVTYTESGTYLYDYYDEEECEHVDTLYLTVKKSTTYTDLIVACDSIQWIDGVTYTESVWGPEVVLTNSVGCDSIVTLRLVIMHSAVEVDSVTVCDSLVWFDGNTYTESTYGPTIHFTDVVGCENATLILNLTVLSSSSSVDTVYACDSYTWVNGVTYTESTDAPTIVYTNAVGCDSVVTLHLTVYHSSMNIDEQVVCDSLTWIDGVTYTESTNLPVMAYTSSEGCDSVVRLHLTVNYSTYSVDEVQTEAPYTWIDGITYYSSVEGPIFVWENAAGCDSVVTLHLEIINSVESIDKQYQIVVYPNPSRGTVSIKLPSDLTESSVEARLYDLYGKLLHRQLLQSDNPTLNLSNYAQGLYLLQLYQQNQLIGTAKISKLN